MNKSGFTRQRPTNGSGGDLEVSAWIFEKRRRNVRPRKNLEIKKRRIWPVRVGEGNSNSNKKETIKHEYNKTMRGREAAQTRFSTRRQFRFC